MLESHSSLCAFHQSTHCHMLVRSSCISPVNTVPHGGHVVHFTSQHSTTWLSGHRAFHQSTQCHMAVMWCISPVNTVQHGCQVIVHFTSQHSATRRSCDAFHQSTQYNMVVRSSCISPINTDGGLMLHRLSGIVSLAKLGN